MDRYNRRHAILNPISLEDIDDCNEWLVGKMGDWKGIADDDDDDGDSDGDGDDFVHDDLTWNVVARASGAEDPERILRSSNVAPQNRSSSSRKKKGKAHVVSSSRPPPPELHDSDSEEEEVDIYNIEPSEEKYVSDGDNSKDGDDDDDVVEEEEEDYD